MVDFLLRRKPPILAEAHPFLALSPQRTILQIAAFENRQAELAAMLNLTLPETSRTRITDEAVFLACAPQTWLAVTHTDNPGFSARLMQRAKQIAAVTLLSDARTILQLHTPKAGEILARLLPIDLHPKAFPADATALTLAGHIPVQIWRDAGGFEIACFRSYGNALYEAIRFS